MAMRKHPSRFRAIRPVAEDLEQRKLLSGTVSGINTEGDAWTLTLSGPGTLSVTKQPDANGNATGLTDPSEISTITIYGTDPLSSRIVGSVIPSGKGDGRVFFQNFTEVTNQDQRGTGGLGPLSIDMPQFYLGLTASTAPTSTNGGTEPAITIPDGVPTLRFGGVDTTAFFGTNVANNLNANGQNNQLSVSLGIPQFAGTRIIVDKIITNSVPPTGTSTTPFQNGVTFQATGRIGLFQANEIDGSTTNQPAAFPNGNQPPTAGGVIVQAQPELAAGITAPIGFVRVGGNATNLFVLTDNAINTYFVGGETNNIGILAAGGTRNLYFGKGMDTANIKTNSVERLFANRGAVNSTVTSTRQIGNIEFGGDVVGTTIRSGYEQNLSAPFGAVPSAILATPTPLAGGQMRVNVAGNITNSIFASSVQPGSSGFGSADDLRLPLGTISARVQGTIDNSTATPQSPSAAFYAQSVKLVKGPVVPPTVAEAPYSGALTPKSLPGVPHPYSYAFNARTRAAKAAARRSGSTS
ncbi:MAG TPA: hypothetical protein VGH33_15795 [Isosphaeraceae bacterium]